MVYAWLYVISCALGLDIVEKIDNLLPASLNLSISCFIASFISLIIFYRKSSQIKDILTKNILTFIIINITTLLVLISSYFSVEYIPVSTYLILFFSFSILITTKNINFSKIIVFISCFLEIIALVIHYNSYIVFIPIFITLIGAISNNIFLSYSKKVYNVTNDNKIILSIRYWLTAVLMLLYFSIDNEKITNPNFNIENISLMLMSIILCLLIPIYFSTKSVGVVSRNKFISISMTTPFLAILLAILINDNWFVIDLFSSALLLIANLIQEK